MRQKTYWEYVFENTAAAKAGETVEPTFRLLVCGRMADEVMGLLHRNAVVAKLVDALRSGRSRVT